MGDCRDGAYTKELGELEIRSMEMYNCTKVQRGLKLQLARLEDIQEHNRLAVFVA
jgi:hypothetical protein